MTRATEETDRLISQLARTLADLNGRTVYAYTIAGDLGLAFFSARVTGINLQTGPQILLARIPNVDPRLQTIQLPPAQVFADPDACAAAGRANAAHRAGQAIDNICAEFTAGTVTNDKTK